jgi:hypothetical protein
MKKFVLVPILIASTLGVVGCSSDNATPTPDREQVGTPNPPLPAEVNAIPFTVGAVAGIGNAEVRMQLTDDASSTDDDAFVLDVWVKSGALEPFTLRPDMFRVYTVDGVSYTPEAVGEIPQFGAATLNTGETYSGLLAVRIPTASEPAMFLADLTDLGDRFFAAAFSVDPNFVPVAPEG